MTIIPDLQNQRQKILAEMGEIQYMRRGTINEQFLKVPQKGTVSALRGPYYVLSWNEDGKTRSIRIRLEELDQVRQDIEAYKHFQNLAKEFVDITETITKENRLDESELKKTDFP